MKETKTDVLMMSLTRLQARRTLLRVSGGKITKHNQEAERAFLLVNLIEWASRESPVKPPSLRHTLDNIDPDYCFEVARFYPDDLRRIRVLLRLDEEYKVNRIRYRTDDALLLACWHFAASQTLTVLVRQFTWTDKTSCQLIIKDIFARLHVIARPLLERSPFLTQEYILRCAKIIARKFGFQYAILFGFIDGKLFRTCKPSAFQRAAYSDGKHHMHGVNAQSVIDPYGLYLHFHGFETGRHHDAYTYQQSGLYELLEGVLGEHVACLFGDSAYPESNRLRPMKKNPRTQPDRDWNRLSGALRVCVEWGFNKIVSLWPRLDVKRKMKMLLSPIGPWIRVCAFLTNCHTLLYGSQVADYFSCRHSMPRLEEYIVLQ